MFTETSETEFSTISLFKNFDKHKRDNGKEYYVETITLNDLLANYNSPLNIDFLSIDTEGSEFDILENFNFAKYTISVIVCEHNFTSNRLKIHSLLTGKGYVRFLESISGFDDWYILGSLHKRIQK